MILKTIPNKSNLYSKQTHQICTFCFCNLFLAVQKLHKHIRQLVVHAEDDEVIKYEHGQQVLTFKK